MELDQIFEDVGGLKLIKKVHGSTRKVKLQKKIEVASLSDRHLVIGKAIKRWPQWLEKELWNIASFELEHAFRHVAITVVLYQAEIVPEGEDKEKWLVSLIERLYKSWDLVEIE